MNIQCPICDSHHELERSDIPKDSADDAEYECSVCYSTMLVGWYAVAEVRKTLVSAPLNEACDWTGEPVGSDDDEAVTTAAESAAEPAATDMAATPRAESKRAHVLASIGRSITHFSLTGLLCGAAFATIPGLTSVDMPQTLQVLAQDYGDIFFRAFIGLGLLGPLLTAAGLWQTDPAPKS